MYFQKTYIFIVSERFFTIHFNKKGMYVESRRTTEESISTILQLLLFFTKSSLEYILFYAHSAPLFLSPYSLLLLNFFSLFILVFIRQRRKSYQE